MSENNEDDLSVRDSIEAAIDSAPDAAPVAPVAPAPVAPAPAATDAAPAAPDAPVRAEPKSPFAPKAAPETPAAPAAPELRAPASWKADLRERWKGLPPDVQSEIVRRERENDQRMHEYAQTRKFAERFEGIVNPYRAFIEAEGAQPLDAFHDYLRTATMLRTGAPMDKARLVAQLVNQYQVPLPALDHYLAQTIQSGGLAGPINGPQMPQFQQQQPQQFRDPRLDQLFAQMQEREQQGLTSDIATFADDPKHEFFDDVRETMADVMDAAAKRGITMGLQDAYDRACLIEPGVKKVLDERNARGNASQAARTLARARHAASSLPSQPAPPAARGNGVAQPESVRDAILSAIDQHVSGA
jgi:hypothetical protein